MQLTRAERKLILLYARLVELYERNEPVGGGYFHIGGTPRAFFWKNGAGQELPIGGFDYIRDHRTAARPRDDSEDLKTDETSVHRAAHETGNGSPEQSPCEPPERYALMGIN